ncbi:hypothetical protein [Undibacterium sp. Xuan67W]|uniref:hypothetical protein n=1 Tax=Undibacterium sp. Xuan67W TaxID=3413057 RepID=UPI003BF05697
MAKLFKTVFVCLMMLAIPFQSFAATSMLLCNSHHHQANHASRVIASSMHQHHVEAGSTQTQHQHAHADLGKCSTCADCCIAAVLMPAQRLLNVERQPANYLPTAFLSYTGFIADHPHPPPRLS